MTTLDAQARADIDSRPWYVAAQHRRDAINIQAFAALRPGRRLTSRSWRGFRLFDEPSYMLGFGHAHLHLPWEVWEVKPTHPLGYQPTLVSDFATRQLLARRIEVVRCMPPGFEFGPRGATVRRLVEDLARAQPADHANRRDYDIAMTFLEDQRGHCGRVHEYRVALATTYLDYLASRSPAGTDGRWRRHLPTGVPARELLDAAVAGLPIPDVVTRRWGLSTELAHSRCSRPGGQQL